MYKENKDCASSTKYWEQHQKEPDKFDYYMMKYENWIRIGPNRTYVRKRENDVIAFDFLCLNVPDNYKDLINKIEEGTITEEMIADHWIKNMIMAGQLIQCKLENFNDTCKFAMAYHFTDTRRKGVNNEALYKKYYEDLIRLN